MFLHFLSALLFFATVVVARIDVVPPYVKQCHEGTKDKDLIKCFIEAMDHLQPYLAKGIKEIDLPPVEPFWMDELALTLTSGPNGYKVTLADIDVYGASNYSVSRLKIGDGVKPFEARIKMPELRMASKYRSSGVLLIIPASGNGTFHGKFQDVTAIVKGTVGFSTKDEQKYMHVETLLVDIDIKHVRLGVKDVYRNNRIIGEAMNLFLRQNGQEVVKAMLPQLRRKLSHLFKSIANQLLTHLPLDILYVPKSS